MDLLALALADPRAAIRQADGDLVADTPQHSAARALWAKGIALRTFGDASGSLEALEAAHKSASGAGDKVTRDEIGLTLSGTLAVEGRFDEAVALATKAEHSLPPNLRPHAWVQLAAFAARAGDHTRAMRLFDDAEAALPEGDPWLARLHNNRGVARMFAGDYEAAKADIETAHRLYARLGYGAATAEATHNLGLLAAQRGDIVTALDLYHQAESVFRPLDYPLNELLTDQIEVMILAGLASEALAAAAEVVETVQEAAAPIDRPEALLMYARAAMLAQRYPLAASAASRAAAQFGEIKAEGWQAFAWLVEASASDATRRSDHASTEAHAIRAFEAGMAAAALQGHYLAAKQAARAGAIDAARDYLAVADSENAARKLPTGLAIARASAVFRIEMEVGETGVARRTALEAMDALDLYRESLVATDARAAVLRIGEDLILDATDLMASDSPETLVAWLNRGRRMLSTPPAARPPRDGEKARLLQNVRVLTTELLEPDSPPNVARDLRGAERTLALTTQELRREAVVKHEPPGASRDPATTIVMATGRARSYIVTTAAEASSIQAVPRTDVVDAADLLRRELAIMRSTVDIQSAAGALDRLLFPEGIPGRGVVTIAPSPRLFAIPWSLLPSLVDRPSVVTPWTSVGTPDQSTAQPGNYLLVEGPGLATAAIEVDAVAREASGARVLRSGEATVDNVLREIEASGVAHIASHARFRSDNPLFSSLQMTDGMLFVHDLELLSRIPSVVVLSSCESAAVTPAGRAMRGFVASLIELGARDIVAGTTTVPDTRDTALIMAAFHREMVRGSSAAEALSIARSEVAVADVPALLAAHTFQCFGIGRPEQGT